MLLVYFLFVAISIIAVSSFFVVRTVVLSCSGHLGARVGLKNCLKVLVKLPALEHCLFACSCHVVGIALVCSLGPWINEHL